MKGQFKFGLASILLSLSVIFSVNAETEALRLLQQSEESLIKAGFFTVKYQASQTHVPGAPELSMAGALSFQTGNRFLFTNIGAFFIYDAQMECVSDGTNYLAVISPRAIQWERNSIQRDFGKSLIHHFVVGGITPIVTLQIMTVIPQGDNRNTKPLPYLTNQFSVSEARLLGDELVEGKASRHVELVFSMGTGEPIKNDLWLDKNTLFPMKRVAHDKSSGDVTETYTLELSPAIRSNTFSPQRVIQSRKLEVTIRQMEQPDALLLKAGREGDVKLAAESISKGANVNAKTTMMDSPPSFSPLLFAAQTGNLELVRLLVENGADVNAAALSGAPPLQFACMEGKAEVVDYLIEHGATVTNATASLCWAVWRGHSNIVVRLVQKGVPINQSAGELGTPLQRATEGGFTNIAAYLIEHGASIEKTKTR